MREPTHSRLLHDDSFPRPCLPISTRFMPAGQPSIDEDGPSKSRRKSPFFIINGRSTGLQVVDWRLIAKFSNSFCNSPQPLQYRACFMMTPINDVPRLRQSIHLEIRVSSAVIFAEGEHAGSLLRGLSSSNPARESSVKSPLTGPVGLVCAELDLPPERLMRTDLIGND